MRRLVAVRVIGLNVVLRFGVRGEPQGSDDQCRADQRRDSQRCVVHVVSMAQSSRCRTVVTLEHTESLFMKVYLFDRSKSKVGRLFGALSAQSEGKH